MMRRRGELFLDWPQIGFSKTGSVRGSFDLLASSMTAMATDRCAFATAVMLRQRRDLACCKFKPHGYEDFALHKHHPKADVRAEERSGCRMTIRERLKMNFRLAHPAGVSLCFAEIAPPFPHGRTGRPLAS